MHVQLPTRGPRSTFATSLRPNSRASRRAEIVDSLVLMIAGLLLPVWLLGHLFLTFYPAPEVVDALDVVPGSNLIADGDSPDGSTPSPMVVSGSYESGNSDTESALRESLDSLTQEFQALTQKSKSLEDELASLQQSKAALETENASLKSQRAAMLAESDNNQFKPSDNSAIVDEIKAKFTTATQELASMKQSVTAAEARYKSAEAEKQTIETDLFNTRNELQNALSKLEQTESNLAAAEKRVNEMLAVPANSSFGEFPSEDDDARTGLTLQDNAKVGELEQTIKQLNLSLNSTSDSLASANKALTARVEELRSTQNDLAYIRNQNNNLKTALTAAQEKAKANELPKEVYRDFVSSKGSVSKMAFVRWEDNDVILVRSFADKKLYRLTLDRFSEADKKYLLEQKR